MKGGRCLGGSAWTSARSMGRVLATSQRGLGSRRSERPPPRGAPRAVRSVRCRGGRDGEPSPPFWAYAGGLRRVTSPRGGFSPGQQLR